MEESEDEVCEQCYQSSEAHCPYCNGCPSVWCDHVVLVTGPTARSEEGGLSRNYPSGLVSDEEEASLKELKKEFESLVNDLDPWCGTDEAPDIEAKLFELDPETMDHVATRDPWDDGQPFFVCQAGEGDISEWLDTCPTNHASTEHVTDGMCSEEVQQFWSEDPRACILHICKTADRLLEPLKTIRKTVQGWPKPPEDTRRV